MKIVIKIVSYLLVAVLASMLTLAAMLPATGGSSVSIPSTGSKLEEMKDLIAERFIGGADPQALEDAAAYALVEATGDRWSYYIPADEYQAYSEQMNNAYVGIGVTIQATEGDQGFLVTKVNRGGPAEEAGVAPGDVIVAIDDTSCIGISIDDTSALVRGPAGSGLSLTLSRDGAQRTVTMIRRTVEVEVAVGTMLEGNIGLVTIYNFDSRCAKESIDAIEDLLAQGAEALIFDVRNNPGGYASELVKVLDRLLPEGELFHTRDYTGKEDRDYSDAKCLELPMAVLVNSQSYSAAEFFAAALRDYDAAIVVGEKTSGKGYFQVNYRLSDGSAVSISIGEYFTPKGENLANVGITPEVEVPVDEQTFMEIYAGTLEPMADPQILAALAELKK